MISQPEISTTKTTPAQTTVEASWKKRNDILEDDLSLEKLMQDKSKHGVFEADFENQNGTTINVRDGDSVLLNCRVYLLHDKTVSPMTFASPCRI